MAKWPKKFKKFCAMWMSTSWFEKWPIDDPRPKFSQFSVSKSSFLKHAKNGIISFLQVKINKKCPWVIFESGRKNVKNFTRENWAFGKVVQKSPKILGYSYPLCDTKNIVFRRSDQDFRNCQFRIFGRIVAGNNLYKSKSTKKCPWIILETAQKNAKNFTRKEY